MNSKTTKTRKISETTGREKWNAKKDDNDIDKVQLSFFKTGEKSLANENPTTDVMDSNDLFGKFIASELKGTTYKSSAISDLMSAATSQQTNSAKLLLSVLLHILVRPF